MSSSPGTCTPTLVGRLHSRRPPASGGRTPPARPGRRSPGTPPRTAHRWDSLTHSSRNDATLVLLRLSVDWSSARVPQEVPLPGRGLGSEQVRDRGGLDDRDDRRVKLPSATEWARLWPTSTCPSKPDLSAKSTLTGEDRSQVTDLRKRLVR